jgi:ferredoxin-thioredoxin reductase catalytic chain
VKEFTREDAERIAEEHGFALSDKADIVIKGVNKKEGNCPCRLTPTPCPCPHMVDEVEKDGKCHCNLFVKKEE